MKRLIMGYIHQTFLENTFVFECQRRGLCRENLVDVFQKFQVLSDPRCTSWRVEGDEKNYLVPFFVVLDRFDCFNDAQENIIEFLRKAVTF